MDNVKLLNNTGSSSDVQNENGATIKVKTNSEVNEQLLCVGAMLNTENYVFIVI